MSDSNDNIEQKQQAVIIRAFKRYHRVCIKSVTRNVRTLDQESALKTFISEEYKSEFSQSEYYRNIRHLKFYRERGSDDHFAVWVDIPTHLAEHPFVIAIKDFLKSTSAIERVKSAVTIELQKEAVFKTTMQERISAPNLTFNHVMPNLLSEIDSVTAKNDRLIYGTAGGENDPLSDNFLNSIHNIKF